MLFVALMATPVDAQQDIVMTLEDEKVTLADFEAIFMKNNRDSVITREDLDEYVELFINFKLKVAEARALGMDTAPAFVSELEGYRKQLTRPYLTDGELLDELVNQAYERKQQEVKASHILIACDVNAAPADTAKAWSKIMKLRNRIMSGEDFESVARGVGGSDDPSVTTNGGSLGYFSVFQMVYPFEEAAYTTEVGKLSMPVRTRYGYHLLKVVDKRPARGELRAAHIMVRANPDNADEVKKAKAKIDNVKQMLDGGAPFEELALKFSEDASTARKGGELPWFGTGKMIESFEDVAFGLQQDGDISEPVLTSIGFHIIKRLEHRAPPGFDEVEKEIRNRVRRDTRSDITRSSFVQKLKKEYAYSVDKKVLKKGINKSLDTTLFAGRMKITNEKCANKTLISFNDQAVSANEFLGYLNLQGMKTSETDEERVLEQALKTYEEETLLAYEDSQLEAKHNEFRLLMNEYRDGILLFELTDEKVWSKAVKDTTGLESFHATNQDRFMWKERAEAGLYGCVSQELAGQVRSLLEKGTPPNEIVVALNEEGPLNVRYEQDKYERGSKSVLDQIDWNTGISNVVEADGKFWVVDFKQVLAPEPKQLDEARGMITAEYQNHLEQSWIQELRGKYKYSVNRDVLYTLISKP